jgi:hypothetical protein
MESGPSSGLLQLSPSIWQLRYSVTVNCCPTVTASESNGSCHSFIRHSIQALRSLAEMDGFLRVIDQKTRAS